MRWNTNSCENNIDIKKKNLFKLKTKRERIKCVGVIRRRRRKDRERKGSKRIKDKGEVRREEEKRRVSKYPTEEK